MIPLHVLIFMVQTEFAQERKALRDQLRGDLLIRWFSGIFLFKDALVSSQHALGLYIDEVKRHDLHIRLFNSDWMLIEEPHSCLQEYRLMYHRRIAVGISVLRIVVT